MRFILFLLAIWVLASIPGAVLVGRLCRLQERWAENADDELTLT